jgi:hypothetical protein
MAAAPNPRGMAADLPDRLDAARNIELRGLGFNPIARRIALVVLGAVLVLGLLNTFGQRPSTNRYTSSEADLELYAPTALRGGLFYQARFTIEPHAKLAHAVLVLSPGWTESQTINTIEPGPAAETSRDGSLALTLGEIPAGQTYTLYLQVQVNPTNVGRRDADVVLYDGDARLLAIRRTVTVYP